MTPEVAKALNNYPPRTVGKFQVFGWLPEDQMAALLESVYAQQQVQVPVIQDERGVTLDGHHREFAHAALKIREPLKVQTVRLPEAEKRGYAIALNLVRRQLSRRERREFIAGELRRDASMSDAWMAEVCGTTPRTVASVREELIANCEIRRLDRFRRRNGGTYPAPQVVTIDRKSKAYAEALLFELGADAPRRTLNTERAGRMLREKRRDALSQTPPARLPRSVRIVKADFRKLDVEDGSVSLIVTDPPYQTEWLPGWSDLAEFASKKLKPGGRFVAYSGVASLPDVMRRLSEKLNYVWTISLTLGDGMTFIDRIQGRSAWCPVLVFTKGPYEAKRGFCDVLRGEQREKDHHEWQKSVAEVARLVELFSEPDDLICDPCGGSFTSAVAAHSMGRAFIGCDLEERNVRIGKQRVAEAGRERSKN